MPGELELLWLEWPNGLAELLKWRGPGWYASQSARGWGGAEYTLTILISTNRDECPDNAAREMGFGTPFWTDDRFTVD